VEKQKPAKRPETNKGGREEEEKRPGISVRSQGPDRLRSTKRNAGINGFVDLWVERKAAGEKFQPIAIMAGFRMDFLAAMGVCVIKIDCAVLL
jgi:hypothetical protein